MGIRFERRRWTSMLISGTLIASSLLGGIGGAGLAEASAPAPAADVNVAVNWDHALDTASAHAYGLNSFQGFNPAVAGSANYTSKLGYMNPGLVRFHSWEMMRDSKAADGQNGWLDNANHTWDADKISQALTGFQAVHSDMLMNIPGWPAWMDTDQDGYLDADQFDAYAAFCAELVKIINVDHHFGVKFWEPTNEQDDRYYTSLVNGGKPDRLDELVLIYNKAAKAMKAVDPAIRTGGLAFARPDLKPQVQRFVELAVQETAPTTLDFLTYHFYGSGDLTQSDETIYNRPYNPTDASANTLATTTASIRTILDTESPARHIPLWLDEYNISWSWTNDDPRMHNEKGAAFDALAMIYAHKYGADGTTAWNDYDGVYGKLTGSDYRLQPNAQTYQLLNNYFVGTTVETTSESEAKIVSYAVKNDEDGTHSLMLVNRTNEVQSVGAAFEGLRTSGAAIQKHQISLQGYGAEAGSWEELTTGGATLPPNSVTVFTDSPVRPTIAPDPLATTLADDSVVTPPLTEGSQGLSGKVDDSSSVNLSSEGTQDWAIWGTNGADPLAAVKPDNGSGLISDLTVIGSEPPTPSAHQATDWWSTQLASWTGGAPAASETGSTAAAIVGGAGNGFSFTVPADTTEKRLKIYLGVMGAKGVLTAHLSDGSSPDFVTSYEDSSPLVINNSGGAKSRVVEINYKAASAGQTLQISYVMNYDHWGNALWIQGATLSTPKAAMLKGTVANSSSVNLTSEGNLDWTIWGTNASDPTIPVKKAAVPTQISDLEIIGTPDYTRSYTSPEWWGTHPAAWTDGAPTAAGTDAISAALLGGPTGTGYRFTVPADTTAKTLKIYLGVMGTKGVLRAFLSDGSATEFVTSTDDNDPNAINSSGGGASKSVSLTYQAASDHQTLTIEYTLNYDHWGNTLWLQGAALSGADILKPSTPAGVALKSLTSTTASLQWDAASDNVGVTGYKIYQGGTLVGRTDAASRSFFMRGLSPVTTYSYTVVAIDAAGNSSDLSAPLPVTTPADTQAPTAPAALAVSGKTTSTVSLVWQPALDNVAVAGYDVYNGDTKLTTVTQPTATLTGLSSGTAFSLSVKAVDAVGNGSQASAAVSVSTDALPSSPTSPPTPQPPANPSPDDASGRVRTLTTQELKPSSSGTIELKLASGVEEVRVPASQSELPSGDLQLQSEGYQLRIPQAVLRQLAKLLPAGNQEQAYLSIHLQAPSVGKQLPTDNQEQRSVGQAKVLSFEAVAAAGSRQSLTTLEQPVVLTLPYATGANAKLIGVYGLDVDAGTWVYAGGQPDATRRQIAVQLDHTGTYTVLEFNKTYTDVPASHWAYEAIQVLSAKHVVNGDGEQAFEPKSSVTRAEFTAMVVRLLGLATSDDKSAFADVPAGQWYASSIEAASKAGLIQGLTDNRFAPDRTMTREEMAALAIRVYERLSGKQLPAAPAKPAFQDESAISGWAIRDVQLAAALGLLQGGADGKFAPQGLLTRAESAQVILNVLNKLQQ